MAALQILGIFFDILAVVALIWWIVQELKARL
jgi:hypothetical protein